MAMPRFFVVYVSTDTGHLYHQEFDDDDDARAFIESDEHSTDRALLIKVSNKCDAYQTVVDIEDHT